MRPLAFLFTRSFVNGIRRSISSPKRAISLTFFGLYYYVLIIRTVTPGSQGMLFPHMGKPLTMPHTEYLAGIVFTLYVFATISMAGSMFAIKGGFRPADIDVLFPTPVDSRFVLVFRMVRDYLFTLLAPLFLGLLGWRGTSFGLSQLVRNYPNHSMDILRAAWIAWSLMALGFVSLGYGVGLFIGRSDTHSDRNQRILTIAVNGLVFSAVLFIALHLHHELSWRTALALTQSTFLQVIFLPAALATDFVMGSLQGNFGMIAISGGGLACVVALGLALAIRQVGWLYDQAAARSFNAVNIRKLRRSGDYYAIAAERARSGKKRKFRISGRIAGYSTHGATALIWKDLLVQLRGPMSSAIITFCGILFGYGLVGWILSQQAGANIPAGVAEIGLPCFAAYLMALMAGFGGFREMLAKVDLLKPLAFTSRTIVFYEAVAKAPIPLFMLFGGSVMLVIFRPHDLGNIVAGYLLGGSLMMEITGSVLFSVVIFPDYEDPTQRGLSALLMVLSIALCSLPGLLVYLGLSSLAKLPPVVAAIPAAVVYVLTTLGLATVAGAVYAGYNPSE